jgi:ribosomal protein S18 acetylase RimI-like enzyme
LRPVTDDDAARIAEIVIAVDIAEVGEPDYSVEALHDEWGEAGFDRDKDAVVLEDDDGAIIGCAHFRGGDLLACVDPQREGEGAGTALLEWAETRARERGDDKLRQGVGHNGASSRALLEAHGFKPVRHYFRLEREVSEADQEPPGLRAVRRADAEALFAIYEAAFSVLPDYTHRPADVWIPREFNAHDVDLELSRYAEGKGFALTRRWEHEAYVNLLAVHPDHAGQGLGSTLLKASFAAAARAGYTRLVLNVASDNPNALRLYERVGMTQAWRIDDYHKPLPD